MAQRCGRSIKAHPEGSPIATADAVAETTDEGEASSFPDEEEPEWKQTVRDDLQAFLQRRG